MGRITHPQPQGMQFDVRISYSDIGRALGVDEETVRTRIKRLQEDGIITGWGVAVNPALLGRAILRFEIPPVEFGAREKVRAGLAALDGAMWLFEYHTGGVALVLFLPPGPATQRTASLIAAFAGTPTQTPSLVLPTPTVEPTHLDWRIVQALRTDPRKPYAALAEEVGASERTVRRRLEALTNGKALLLVADIDATKIRGAIPVTAMVDVPPGPGRVEVERLLRGKEGLIFFASDERGVRGSHLADAMADVDALHAQLAAIPGVQRVRVEFQLRRLSVGTWMDEEIARRAAVPG